jgi:hypothetical protein
MYEIEVTATTTAIEVRAPYHPDFPAAARRLDGIWSSTCRCWTFRAAQKEGVHALLSRIFGWTPAPSGATAVIRVTLDAWNARESEVRLTGRTLAARYSRDGAVIIDPVAVIIDGEFAPAGGSRRRPAVIDDQREVTLEVTLPEEALEAATELEWTRVEPEPEPEPEPEAEPEAADAATAALDEVAADLIALADGEDIDLHVEDGTVGATMSGAEFTALGTEDGEVIITRILPDGEEMYDDGPARPTRARTTRLFRAWVAETHAVLARRQAEAILRGDAMEAAVASLLAEGDGAPHGTYGWGDETPTWNDLTLPHGSVLRRRYVGVSPEAPTGWEWEARGRLRRADAPAITAMVRAGVLPATLAAPALPAATRERIRGEAIAAALDRALEDAGAQPAWERALMREGAAEGDPESGLPEEATLTIIDRECQWALAIAGPAGTVPINPAATGTMPAWASGPALREWITSTLGAEAAAHADLAGLD